MNKEDWELFHRLWTANVGTPGYVKADWKRLDVLLSGASGVLFTRDQVRQVATLTWALKSDLSFRPGDGDSARIEETIDSVAQGLQIDWADQCADCGTIGDHHCNGWPR